MQQRSLPPRLGEIVEDFRESDRGEKLELLLEFSDRMPGLPNWLDERHDQMTRVHECMTPVFIHAEQSAGGELTFYFDVPPESPTTRGYASLMAEGLAGATPEQVLAIPADFFQDMGLQEVLSPQRLNGISAILAYIKRLAVATLA